MWQQHLEVSAFAAMTGEESEREDRGEVALQEGLLLSALT